MNKKNLIITSILSLCFIGISFASKVEKNTAEKVARNFYYEKINQFQETDYNQITFASMDVIERNGQAVYYIFNLKQKGFVIVSAEDAVYPVLGYSFESQFKSMGDNPAIDDWMTGYEKQIEHVVKSEITATEDIKSRWNNLQTNDPNEIMIPEDSKSVSPLIKSKWGQGTYYNKFCPADPASGDGRCPSGCTSTAMSQVMYYYRYPYTGFGTKTYSSNYGYLTADFGNTTYDYDNMVNTPGNNTGMSGVAISELMYHAGVGVSMDYGPDGSSAGLGAAASALKIFFLYSSSTSKIDRSGMSNSQWKNYLTANLENNKPVIYAGYPSSGNGSGHAFVCDGYQGTEYFHFNWGWSGSSDGYFYIDNLNPGGLDYNDGNRAVVNIYPKNSYPYFCSNQKIINSTSGTFQDGSGPMDYEVNADCSWLITAPDNDSIINYKLSFDALDTEAGNDIVTIYDGETTSDPVLGTFSGSTVPSGTLTSSGKNVLVTFTSDGTNTSKGWQIKYTSTSVNYCNILTLTDGSGTLSDGSGDKNYSNNSSCLYFIRPTDATSVTLHFTKFETEAVNDFVVITDANNGTFLGKFSGSNLPPSVTSHTGAIQLFFKSDWGLNADGWEAYYDTLSSAGIDEINILESVEIYPNPAHNNLNIQLSLDSKETTFNINLVSVTGQIIYTEEIKNVSGDFTKQIDVSGFNKGVYFLQLRNNKGIITKKIIFE